MMRSEFIERTKFEPTAAEYEEIENEYMGTDLDKDAFCKLWKKQGGAERLMRLRARRIEELEAEIAKKDKEYDERVSEDSKEYNKLVNSHKEQMAKMENDIRTYKWNFEETDRQLADANRRADEAERKLAVLKEAFAIITGKEETA